MYLKEIELENFKSFAHRTTIPLLPGYTAITGPNGAGKSNIADAILFVLGPRSSRVIRAGKLTDLIFNGGKAGKAANGCKVSLYFDNSDRLIPFDADTVKLTRLVKVSETADGYYSYYYVNDKKSSLGEIESLLSHTRISADGYNFVQQGDITKIVEMGNLDRRRILDDIAGISRFDDDIARAEKERLEAENNIDKLKIIIDEIKKQMKQLEADREGAIKYRDLRDKLLLSKAQLAAKKKEEVEREIVTIQKQIVGYEKEKQQLLNKIEKAGNEIKEIEQDLAEVEEKIIEAGGDSAREIKEKLDGIRINLARAEDAISNSEDQLKILSEENENFKEEISNINAELKELAKKRDESSAKNDEKNKELEKIKASLAQKQEKVSESDSKLGEMHDKFEQLMNDITSKEDRLRMLSIEQDKLASKVDRLRSEIAEMEENKKTYEFELKDAEWSVKEISGDRKSLEKEHKKLEKEINDKRAEENDLQKESKELEEAITSLTREYNKLKAEADAARMVAEGYTASIGRLIEARDKGQIKGIHGTVSELCDVDRKFETALTVAAGNRLQAIIVEDDEVAAQCIGMLKKNKLGRAIFLPLNKMVLGKARGKAILASKKSLGYAIDLVQFDEKYRAALWFVLGDTVVVNNLSEARAMMGGIRIVTIEGELIEPSGAMMGGTLDRKGAKFSAPSSSQIDKVAKDLRKATEQAEKVNARLWELKDELKSLEERLKSIGMSDSGRDVKLSSIELKQKEFAQKIQKVREELDSKGKELSESLDSQEETSKELKDIEANINKLKKKRDELRDTIQKATPKDVAKKMKEAENQIIALTEGIASLVSERDTAIKQIELVEKRKEEFESSINSNKERQKEHKKKIKESEKRIEELQTELNANRKIEESMGAEIERLRNERDELYKQQTELEAAIEKHRAKIETNQDLAISLKTKEGAAEGALAELMTELSGYEIDVTNQKLPPINELKEFIHKAEGELNSLGVVNLRAIEDYDEKSERYESVKSEITQLKKQRTNLMKLVSELNEKKKIGLLKTYDSIKDNFSRIYSELSAGGEAELLLENPEDPLSGGLIIKARPRNRKSLRLEALSGGEKSLTALSFIFAIQHYMPSPFYMLDEVDMFLDSVNAENVARTISRNSENAQFIQVSLRKVTLRESDHIIGTTLRSNGVTQVIIKPNIGIDIPETPEPEMAKEAS